MPYLVGESARHKGRQLCARLQTSPRGKAGSACGRKDGGESEDRLLVSRSEDRQANSLTPVLSESCQLVVSCSFSSRTHFPHPSLGYFLQDHEISRCVIYSYLYTARNPRKTVEYSAKIWVFRFFLNKMIIVSLFYANIYTENDEFMLSGRRNRGFEWTGREIAREKKERRWEEQTAPMGNGEMRNVEDICHLLHCLSSLLL